LKEERRAALKLAEIKAAKGDMTEDQVLDGV